MIGLDLSKMMIGKQDIGHIDLLTMILRRGFTLEMASLDTSINFMALNTTMTQ